MSANITGVFPGCELVPGGSNPAVNTADYVVIPTASIHSLAGITQGTGDADLCFGLIDSISKYLLGSGVSLTQRYNNVQATETDRIQDSSTLRKDYAFRVNLQWNSDVATNTMNVKPG